MTPTIKFKVLHKDFKLPTKAKEGDAAYDVVATSMEVKEGYIEYGLGFSTEIPEGWEAKMYPRSSISNYDLVICNHVPLIDSGYRGEWKVRMKPTPSFTVRAMGSIDVEYTKYFPRIYQIGDRIAQVQFAPLPKYTLELVEELSDSQRSTGGFGSSGV